MKRKIFFTVVCLMLLLAGVTLAEDAERGKLQREIARHEQDIEKASAGIVRAEAAIAKAKNAISLAREVNDAEALAIAQKALRIAVTAKQKFEAKKIQAEQKLAHYRKSYSSHEIEKVSPQAAKEQDEFDRMNEAWLRKQQELIREAVERDKKWTNEVFSAIKQIRLPELDRPSILNDLKPGDIILVSPDKESLISRAIPTGDQFIRAANHLAKGKVFEAAKTEKIPVSHSLAFVKSVGENRLYLDHTWDDGYSRILDEREFQKRYGNRLQYLARPKAPIDGKKLWKVSREAALKDTRYGFVGEGDAVCSEVDRIAIVKASGKRLHLEGKRLGPVDLTPADFYDEKTNGKYFIVSPLKNEP